MNKQVRRFYTLSLPVAGVRRQGKSETEFRKNPSIFCWLHFVKTHLSALNNLFCQRLRDPVCKEWLCVLRRQWILNVRSRPHAEQTEMVDIHSHKCRKCRIAERWLLVIVAVRSLQWEREQILHSLIRLQSLTENTKSLRLVVRQHIKITRKFSTRIRWNSKNGGRRRMTKALICC